MYVRACIHTIYMNAYNHTHAYMHAHISTLTLGHTQDCMYEDIHKTACTNMQEFFAYKYEPTYMH